MATGTTNNYARGHLAWFICGRCGIRGLLRDSIFDGYFPWLRVHDECYDSRHPQERLVSVTDPVALYRPSPENFFPPTAPVISGEITLPLITSSGSLSIATSAPTLVGRIAPSTGSLTLTTFNPFVFKKDQPRTATLSISGSQPVMAMSVLTHTGSLSMVGNTSRNASLIQTHAGSLALVGQALAELSKLSIPNTGSLSIQGQLASLPVTPGTGSLSITGIQPSVIQPPGSGALSMIGTSPDLLGRLAPGTSGMVISGNAPTRTP